MLTKDQANAAADVLLEANKSAPQVKRKALKNVKFRAIGGILGFLIALLFNSVFDLQIMPFAVIFIVAGILIGELIGKQHKKKGA